VVIGRTLILWWGRHWQGVGLHRWDGPLARTYIWSLLLGIVELRRLR
jgi:hypothetical protein